jgi:hypothetical protein
MPEKVHLTKRIIENLQPSTDKKPRRHGQAWWGAGNLLQSTGKR